MSTTTLDEDDVGKRLVTSDGNELGMIVDVEEDTPCVEVNPDVFDRLKAKFDWGDPGEESYPVKTAEIAEVTEDEVRLR